MSADADAARAYQEGRTALRMSDWPRARDSFQHALDRDPDCAPAAVEMLLMAHGLNFMDDMQRYRELYRRADARRDRLGERDIVLLDAVQPFIMHDPPDLGGMHARLVAASDRFGKDAEVAYWAVHANTRDAEAQLRGADRVLALDPGYLDASQVRAGALMRLGRLEEAIHQLDDCVARSPGSECASDRVMVLCNAGRHDDAVAAARAYVIASAGVWDSYEALSLALAAEEAPDASIAEAIRQFAAPQVASVAEVEEPVRLANLDVLRGRFAAAERRARDLATRIDRRPDARAHELGTWLLAELLREKGDAAGLIALAADFEARLPIWNRGAAADAATPTLLAALDDLGRASHDEVLRKMTAWQEAEVAHVRVPEYVWGSASLVARTADEARPFLAVVSFPADSAYTFTPQVVPQIGRLQLVAGDAEAAVKTLEAATRGCGALWEPFTYVRAFQWLGQAEEARGDKPAACAAYAEVLRRWGVETPLARTAQAAKARRTALRCP